MSEQDTNLEQAQEQSPLDEIDQRVEEEAMEELPEGDSEENEETQDPQNPEQPGEAEKPVLTEKGTKLDPDPQSALHQQLANERRARLEAEQRFIEVARQMLPAKQEEPKPFIDPTRLQSANDVAGAINEVYKLAMGYKSEIDSLKSQLGQSSQILRESQNYESLGKEVSNLKEAFPELDSRNESKGTYNKDLDQRITRLYASIAYDSKGNLLPNRVSLEAFATPIVEAIRLATGQGSKQAQTRIVQKNLGKVQTSKKQIGETLDSLSPAERLEQQMEKMGHQKEKMPEASYGQRTTLSAPEKDLYINIEKNIKDFPDYRRELIKRLDGSVFEQDIESHKYEWSARRKRALKAKLAQAYTTGTTIVVDEPGVFNVDDVIAIGGKQARVLQVTGGVSVVFTPIAGDTIDASDVGTVVSIVAGGTPHGKKADNMISSGHEDYYNYVGNFEAVVEVSTTDEASKIRGRKKASQLIVDEQMYLTQKLQKAIVVGKRYKDSVNNVTTMGGVKNLIDLYAPQNAIDFGGSAMWEGASADRTIQDKLDSVFGTISEKAFQKPVMWVGPSFMGKFKHIQTGLTYTSEMPKGVRGVGVVRKYQTHVFGEIDVVQLMGLDDVMDDMIIITDESDIGYKPLINWRTYPLGRVGQSKEWQVEGIFGFKMGIPEAHAYLYNLGL